jgi:class 3 adenylate cyclase
MNHTSHPNEKTTPRTAPARYRLRPGMTAARTPATADSMESPPLTGLPRYRTVVALDIEHSTSRPDPVKAKLRSKTYELFDSALCSAGICRRHRDRYIDRGDGLLALIHPVDRAPKALLLNRAIPALNDFLTDYNASLPYRSRPQRQLRIRVTIHAGDVRYDANGCFGETLDVAFRLLDAAPVKKALRETAEPLILVISGDIYNSVVRHGYDGIDQHAFHPLVRVQIAGKRYPGWIHMPGRASQHVTQIAGYRRLA